MIDVPSRTDLIQHVTYLDPHAIDAIQCHLDSIKKAAVFYSHNKWFGWKVASTEELCLSVASSHHIKLMETNVLEGKKLHTSYIPNLAGATSVLSENHMCAWLSVLSMYKTMDIRSYHLLKCCYDRTEEK